MKHEEVFVDTWKNKKRRMVLCKNSFYSGFSNLMEDTTGFEMKDCLSLPRLGRKYFISLRIEDDEPITHIMMIR